MPLIKSQTQHLKPGNPADAQNSIKLKVTNFSNGRYSDTGYMHSRCEASPFAKIISFQGKPGDPIGKVNQPESTELCQMCFEEKVMRKMHKCYLPDGRTTGWVCKSCRPSPNGNGYGRAI